jgi:vacuole morphology and inheritance protein 14
MEQEYFIQLSQLVQLIESSLFNNIRVLLLEPVKNIYLIKTLYGILMLLPQGKAYTALSKRMKSIEMLLQIDSDITGNKAEEK